MRSKSVSQWALLQAGGGGWRLLNWFDKPNNFSMKIFVYLNLKLL